VNKYYVLSWWHHGELGVIFIGVYSQDKQSLRVTLYELMMILRQEKERIGA